MKKVLLFICGIALIVFGIITLCYEEMLIFACGLGLIVYGVGTFLTWTDHRKTGTANKWSLVIAIAAIAAGAAVFVGGIFEAVAVGIVMLIISFWLIFSGVLEVIGAIMYRKAMTSADLGVQAPGSITSLVLGGVMVAVGLLVLVLPQFGLFTTALIIAVAIIVGGVRMIMAAFSVGAIFEKDNAG